MPRPLLSEALRGHGALLRDSSGKQFVDELQPRDVVSRAEAAVMLDQHVDHVWLDATGLEDFDQRFPTIAAELRSAGLDPSRDWLPVAPAAHYTCGGILTDLDGASSLAGLWAAGEAADTGVHGANRLASNSLLEGMVFGPRAVEAIERGVDGPAPTGAMRAVVDGAGHGSIGGIRLARPAPPPARRRRGARLKAAAKTLFALAILAAIGTGLYALSRQVYFIGTNDAGLVTLYRGVPYELPFGVDLYEQEYASGVPARAIPSTRRNRVLDHEWRGRDDAEDLLRTLERGQLSG
jgi:hypothetical protein